MDAVTKRRVGAETGGRRKELGTALPIPTLSPSRSGHRGTAGTGDMWGLALALLCLPLGEGTLRWGWGRVGVRERGLGAGSGWG